MELLDRKAKWGKKPLEQEILSYQDQVNVKHKEIEEVARLKVEVKRQGLDIPTLL